MPREFPAGPVYKQFLQPPELPREQALMSGLPGVVSVAGTGGIRHRLTAKSPGILAEHLAEYQMTGERKLFDKETVDMDPGGSSSGSCCRVYIRWMFAMLPTDR